MADSAGRKSHNTRHARRATRQLVWLILAALATAACLIGGGLQAQQPPPPAPTAPAPPTVAPIQPTTPPVGPGAPQPTAPPVALPGSQAPDAPPVPTVVPLAQAVQSPVPFTAPRMPFKIDPNTPLKDLLPTPPKAGKSPGPMLTEDLTHVPEVEFQAIAAGQSHAGGPIKVSPLVEFALDLLDVQQPLPSLAALDIAHQIAKINHLNSRKTDGFVEALRGQRPDLTGLPFAMGDACRTKGERSRQFANAATMVRRSLQQAQGVRAVSFSATTRAIGPVTGALIGGSSGPPIAVGTTVLQAPAQLAVAVDPANRTGGFWEQYEAACADEDRGLPKADRALREHVTLARIAALMQILAPEAPDLRLGLVKYLAGVSHSEATRALARLAVFAAEDEVRLAAVEALKVRRERDYTDILVQGLRHPWPAAARHAADAIARLERTDLTPQLVALLEDPDPRAPALKEVNGKKAPVVREMVRVNHHRSCLLCHAPGNTGTVSAETLTAAVPTPGEPLPGPAEGYNNNASPDMLVRLDVTYLRQDFSVFQAVADTAPWPELQRFDFLVRERVLTEEEAATFRAKLEDRDPGRLPPHQRAALAALRELTGKDTVPTAEAWRKLLGLPGPASGRPSSSTTTGGG
jgi:hypothetical protein